MYHNLTLLNLFINGFRHSTHVTITSKVIIFVNNPKMDTSGGVHRTDDGIFYFST